MITTKGVARSALALLSAADSVAGDVDPADELLRMGEWMTNKMLDLCMRTKEVVRDDVYLD